MNRKDHQAELGRWSDLLDDRLAAVLSREGSWTAVSAASERILGWRPEELQGQPLDAHVHPDDQGTIRALLSRSPRRRGGGPVRQRIRHRNGTYRLIEWRTTQGRDRIHALGRDVTAERDPERSGLSEAELRTALDETAALLEATLETVDQGLLVFDADERIQAYNRRALELLDLPAALMEPRPTLRQLIEHQHAMGEFGSGDETQVERLPEHGLGAARDERVRPNGTVLEIRTVPLARGGAVRTYKDLTIRRRAEQRQRASEARYRLLTESLTDMIVRADPTGLRTYVSPACRDILGYAPEELVGTRAADTAHPDDVPALRMNLAAIGRGEVERTTMSYRLRHRAGHWVPIEASFRVVRSASGEPEGIISVSRDISDRRRLEAQFQQAQKMEAMGQLTGGIAHDFNNLLTVVMGNAEVLVEEPSDPRMTRELAEMILETAEKGSQLASHLLAFGRRQSLRPQRVRLEDVVRSMMPLIARTAGETIEVASEFASSFLLALTDRALLESAILNLVVNARDAMPTGGTLTIRTGQSVAAPGEGQLPFGQPVVFLTVSDTGTGMPPEVMARAFEPFFTTKEVGKGTGLGLSMIYGFAQQSGGHVSLDSQAGLGTSVTILLPGVTGRPVEDAVIVGGPVPRAERERVLLVEDEPRVLQFASSQLENLGYEVTAVSSGPDALNLLGEGTPFDLLFTDVVLPKGMSGVELARRARALRPDMKVLLASGYSEESFKHYGRPEKGTVLLKKPYRRKQLAETLRKVLEA